MSVCNCTDHTLFCVDFLTKQLKSILLFVAVVSRSLFPCCSSCVMCIFGVAINSLIQNRFSTCFSMTFPSRTALLASVGAVPKCWPLTELYTGWPKKVSHYQMVKKLYKRPSMGSVLFVKLKYESSTIILFIGIRYSMRDLISDLNNYA